MRGQAPDPVPADLEPLLEAERKAPDPGGDVRQRVRERLLRSIAKGAPAPGADSPGARPTLAAKPIALWTAAVLLAAASSAGLYAAFREEPQQPARSSSRPEPPPPAAISAPLVVDEPLSPAVAPMPPALPSATGPRVPRPSERDQLARERAILEVARIALTAQDPAQALDAVRRHQSEFPGGKLREEREALWVKALALKGDGEAARARGERFLKEFPESMLIPAVEAAMRSVP